MKTLCASLQQNFSWLILFLLAFSTTRSAAELNSLEAGLAVRDITPEVPIRLAGYSARNKPADKIDSPLVVQALALKNSSGERFVFIALDNCEVSRAFNAPVLKEAEEKFGLGPGTVMIISSHTHSAPVLQETLVPMYQFAEEDAKAVERYSQFLRAKLVEVIGAALADLKPAQLEHGIGRATFAMNRRIYSGDKVNFGENPDAPVDWDVPVLKIKGATNNLRAIVFGYACHGTSIAGGEGFYSVTGEYMAYARQHIEGVYPGTMALYFQGMGADSNPSPRGHILDSKRHGLELAGAVIGVLNRPMRPVRGSFKMAYDEVELPFVDPPTPAQLENDSHTNEVHIRRRAELYQKSLAEGKPLPKSIKLPIGVVRIGDDLTFVAMAGEVVVDYATQFKRQFAADHPWLIGYAYEVPCYIPSARILKEGGYEAESSLIYYGFYGPFRTRIEQLLVGRMNELVNSLRATKN